MLISDRHIKNNVVKSVLKEAWARFGPVRMSEVNASTLVFDFDNSRDIDQVLELSPWSIHGHCLNLKFCLAHKSDDEIDFGRVQMWVQIHGLSLEMFNKQNAQCIGDSIGQCLRTEDVQTMHLRTFLRVQVDVDISMPLMSGSNGWTREGN